MINLTNLEYWISVHGIPDLVLDNEIIEEWINTNLKDKNISTMLEIGCFPGKYLTILGKDGVEVNGIDYIPDVLILDELFKRNGFKVGEFINADFTEYKFERKYDCVMSFGFIEHFYNWEQMILKHLDLVANNGFVVIEVPNFSGFFQRIPRMIFDWKNYKRHNIESMNLEKWVKILEYNNYEIVAADYFGEYNMWFESKSKNKYVLKSRFYFVKLFQILKTKMFPITQNNKHFSSFIGIIAQKKAIHYI